MYALPSACAHDFHVIVEAKNLVVLLKSTLKLALSFVRVDNTTVSITVLYSRWAARNCVAVRQVVLQTPRQIFSHAGYS